jgi:saccharopine dehydrogenase-like NADP-dependent oxidoreductase
VQLKALGPDLVIHCAGPFQNQDYRVALASMACKAHYIDIADGRDFVAGFVGAVGPAVEAAGCFAVTGASTLPALSSAVVDSLKQSLTALRAIDIIIAPGQHAPRGAATVAAVLGYAGQSFLWRRDGEWRSAYGWQELKREQFSFGSRFAAACDVPDLELLPARYPGIKTVTFRAALEVTIQHFALWMIAACRRTGLRLPTARWSTFLDRVGTLIDS